jgi:hypothetical protein
MLVLRPVKAFTVSPSADQFEIDLKSAIGFGRSAVTRGEGDPVFGRRRGHECVVDRAASDAEFREPGVEPLRALGAEESRAGEVVRE